MELEAAGIAEVAGVLFHMLAATFTSHAGPEGELPAPVALHDQNRALCKMSRGDAGSEIACRHHAVYTRLAR